ncbi:MAG: AMP-binding protein [Mariprofundus sp.]|nr:AMP-binding protein [Mariprofundus sp.]
MLAALERHAVEQPERIALDSGKKQLTYQQLLTAVTLLATELHQTDAHALALAADNSPAWAVADLACVRAGITLIPVPHFFSPAQIGHLLRHAGVDAVITDRADSLALMFGGLSIAQQSAKPLSIGLDLIAIETPDVALPQDCAKVTFTSGSTGEPKGVCLNQSAMETVAFSLAESIGACRDDRHLSLLPYATLLENIGGLYTPLIAGARIVVPGMAGVGMSGASGLDIGCFMAALHRAAATTCIMIPQMLHALVAALGQGAKKPATLRYLAVGGAPVSKHLLACAEAFALPVFEGYGLSEAASVVAVNSHGICKPGSVGKPLTHVDLKFAEDGEILVRGALFSGYLGDIPHSADDYWPTGDIGYLDEGGFLHLSGRKKHIFITAFGRNVSPEWVEQELSIELAIGQCCVFGEARPFNVAIIVARQAALADAVEQAIEAANARLPDYARVSRWIVADDTFSVANGLWTGTGRPRRQHIFNAFEERIDQLYNVIEGEI